MNRSNMRIDLFSAESKLETICNNIEKIDLDGYRNSDLKLALNYILCHVEQLDKHFKEKGVYK